MSRAKAQTRAGRIAAFQHELRALEDAGVLTLSSEVRRRVDAYHDQVLTDLRGRYDLPEMAASRRPWGMEAAGVAGAIMSAMLLLAGLLALWPYLTLAGQAALSAVPPIILLCLTEALQRAGRSRSAVATAAALTLIGFLLGLHGLGTVFSRPPSLMMLAAPGLLAVALGHRYRLPPLAVLGLVALVAYSAAVVATLDASLPSRVMVARQDPVLMAGLVLLGASVWMERRQTALAPAYRVAGAVAVGYALAVLSVPGTSVLGPGAAPVYLAVGPVFGLGLLWLALRQGWPWTRRIALLSLFAWAAVRVMPWINATMPPGAGFGAVAVLAIALIWLSGLLQGATAGEAS